MNIDHELVAQAQEILGTDTATATVHQALRAVIRRFRLEQVASLRFADGDWTQAKRLRQPRHLRVGESSSAAHVEVDAS